MIQSGLVAFFIFDRIAKSIAQPQHPFIGGLATCCNIVHLVGKSLPLLILSRTFFLKFQFSPYLRTKHDFSKKIFFTGSAAKLIGTKSGGMLYYFNSLLIKKNPSPQPAAGAEFVFWFCAASFTCLWHRQYCWWIRCYCSLILPYDNSIIMSYTGIVMLSYYQNSSSPMAMLLHDNRIVWPYCHVTKSLYCHMTMSSDHQILMWSYDHMIIWSYYHMIICLLPSSDHRFVLPYSHIIISSPCHIIRRQY